MACMGRSRLGKELQTVWNFFCCSLNFLRPFSSFEWNILNQNFSENPRWVYKCSWPFSEISYFIIVEQPLARCKFVLKMNLELVKFLERPQQIWQISHFKLKLAMYINYREKRKMKNQYKNLFQSWLIYTVKKTQKTLWWLFPLKHKRTKTLLFE